MKNDSLLLNNYDYSLQEHRIAKFPVSPRDQSRLLCVHKEAKAFSDHTFQDLPQLLEKGDLLVLNNTRVIPARLQSNRGEVFLVREVQKNCWDCIIYPGKHFKPGTELEFQDRCRAEVLSQSRIGRLIQFERDVKELYEKHGQVPLPPYIAREAVVKDKNSYQTIYARIPGSVAAPTAGLHFTKRVFQALKERGIETVKITLHVGPGTFRPVKEQIITNHQIDPEFYECKRSDWNRIQKANRVIAVGTTVVRTLETIATSKDLTGYTNLFIYPGHHFQVVKALITNFHLPKSSLLMLVSAFGGIDLIQTAYQHAIHSDYRFYSYGDAMLVL